LEVEESDSAAGAGLVSVAVSVFGVGSTDFPPDDESDFSSDLVPYFIPDGDLWSVE
jgi:hypothetical protein